MFPRPRHRPRIARLADPRVAWSPRRRITTPALAAPRVAGAPLTFATALIAFALAALAFATSPAGAVVVSGEFGVQPRQSVSKAVAPLQYHNGPVVTASFTYAIYWDPVGAYHPDWMTLIDGYLHDVGAASGRLDNVFSLSGQYTGLGGTRASYKSTFRGAYTDTDPYPPNGCTEPLGQSTCLSAAQIAKELEGFVTAHHLQTGVDVVYFLLTPPGVTVCTDGGGKGNCSDSTTEKEEEAKGEIRKPDETDGICGYHAAIEPGSASPIVYAVQPWVAGDAGHVVSQLPLTTKGSTGSVLACQNGSKLVEPNQTSTESRFDGYETGLADVIINGLSVEQSDVVVNPLLNGWYQEGTKAEQSDMCQRVFSPVTKEQLPEAPQTTHALSNANETIDGHSYYLQWAFSSPDVTSGKGVVCWEGTELDPHFTAANPVGQQDLVAFDANESGITLDANTLGLPPDEPFTAPVYKWQFGDGAGAEGPGDASELHGYEYGGEYPVTLTVTDSGGNSASYTADIAVAGPPRPGATTGGSTPAAAGGSSAAAPAAASNGSSSVPVSKATVPGPVTTQSVLSSRLRRALRRGLPVGYSVSQQAAGHFEVLLAAALAGRLGLHLPPAGNLPAGTPPQVVAARALLITTRPGRGTLNIQFGRITAKRLGRLHRVELLLRLEVRNGGGGTTTALSKVTLH